MPRRDNPEEIVVKPRQLDVVVSQGIRLVDAMPQRGCAR
jgi:hypothetical protein